MKLSNTKGSFVKGFTAIELLLVLSMIGIMAAAVTPFMSKLILFNNIDVVTDDLFSSIRKAQIYSMDAKDGETWGVCVVNSYIRLFSGSCSTPNFSEEFRIPSSVSVNGFSEVTFSRYRGEPSVTQTFTLSTSLETVELSLNEVGVLEIN